MKNLKKYAIKYWKPFIIAVIILSFEALCDLIQPTLMSKVIDIGIANKNIDYVIKFAGIMFLVAGVGAVFAISRSIISVRVSQSFGAELRNDLFAKINSLSFNDLDKFERASLITRLTNDISQVQNVVNGLMRVFIKAPLLCIGSIIMAIRLNSRISIIIVTFVPLVVIAIVINMKVGFPLFRKVQKALDKVNSKIREYLAGVRVVKAFNRFQYEVDKFEEVNQDLFKISSNSLRIMAVFTPIVTLLINLGICVVIWVGGIGVKGENIQVGEIVAFINYMTQILSSLLMIGSIFNNIVSSKASLERISEVFDVDEKEYEHKQRVQSDVKGKVEFIDVSFSYESNRDDLVIRNITFTVEPGETIGIIGPTGSGKTSLINLIPRFYEINKGRIIIDGVNIDKYDVKELREKIAIVPQKNVLFKDTVINNIKWGNENATKDQVEKIAKIANAHEFISSFNNGYDTLLGRGGVNVSGGQKQRISIARALIKNPEILILDDCTSAIDVVTESKIREGLRRYSSNLTCIIIAQRITSIMDTDKIIVLDNGEIVGCGIHSELINSCKVYREIYKSQMGEAVVGYDE